MWLVEIVAVIMSMLSVWLTARRRLLCWPVGLVSVGLYSWVFFKVQLYSDLLLQVIFAFCLVYGWRSWLRGRCKDQEVLVERLPRRSGMMGLLIGGFGAVLLGYAMARLTNASLPWIDSALTSFSLVAQFWMGRRYVACWVLWIVIDVIYVGMYAVKHLHLTALLYAVFVVLALFGWKNWRQALDRQQRSLKKGPQQNDWVNEVVG